MASMRLYLLGPPCVQLDGATLSLDTRKAVAMLAYLAVSGPHATRAALAALLFPESGQARASANLRRTLYALNKAGIGPCLEIRGEQVGLRRGAGLWIDVDEFHDLIAASGLPGAAGHAPARDPSPATQSLAMAASLYRGDFLAGFSLKDSAEFDEWQFFQAEGLRRELAGLLEHLSRELATGGRLDEAIAHGRRWLSLDPLHEPAHRWLMRLYAQAGQRAAALRQYQECAHILREELGAGPEAETVALYEEIKRERQGPQVREETLRVSRPGPPARPQPPVPAHNLPVSLTPFIGRRKELEQIRNLLAIPDCRLLTLLGPGGIGKTRLAVQAGGEVLRAFRDGVCFVGLSQVAAPELVATAVLAGLRATGLVPQDDPVRGDSRTALFRHLRDRQVLLVMDNFGHLLPCAGLLSEMLQQAPEARILVTSRERLGLPEEWALEIGGLDYPEEPPAQAPGLQPSAWAGAAGELESFERDRALPPNCAAGAPRFQPNSGRCPPHRSHLPPRPGDAAGH